jgi:hypothetical protein
MEQRGALAAEALFHTEDQITEAEQEILVPIRLLKVTQEALEDFGAAQEAAEAAEVELEESEHLVLEV